MTGVSVFCVSEGPAAGTGFNELAGYIFGGNR